MRNVLFVGDAAKRLVEVPDGSVHCCVTSPPYFGLRDYGAEGQIGNEDTPDEYVEKLVEVFRQVERVLRSDGTVWLNLGDSYSSSPSNQQNGSVDRPSHDEAYRARGRTTRHIPDLKPKNLIGIPWRVAFALQAEGWYLRSDIIWSKGNPMPEPVQDRPTKSHEYVFLLTKNASYFYDADAIRESNASNYSQDAIEKAGGAGGERPAGNNFHKESRHSEGAKTPRTRAERAALLNPSGRNKRSVWTINPRPFRDAHFAVFPPELPTLCIKAGTSEKGCCPTCGAPWERAEQVRSWEPGCKCPAHEPVPCVVLDPFAGSGTTLEVAKGLGREFIGIELNPKYAEMIKRRIDEQLWLGQKPMEVR